MIEKLKALSPTSEFEVKVIQTKGDLVLDRALDKIGDKGLFVKEIESALLEGDIDFAVHSMKDMPGEVTEGLAFSTTPEREDNRDVLVLKEGMGWQSLMDLPLGSVIGTGSKRRIFQLKALRPDLEFVPVRGNIETRMNKIETENLVGVVLAAAGLKRLNLEHRITSYLDQDMCLPAPAQGALAIQYRVDDTALADLLNGLGHEVSHITAVAERCFLNGIAGSCHIPIGAKAEIIDNTIHLVGLLGSEDGSNLVKLEATALSASESEAEKLGKTMALEMMKHFETPPMGKVYLIGAGPGDEGLMTVKGKALLEAAEAVVYDKLVSDAILNWIPQKAETYYVGKASSEHAMQQEDINLLLARLGKEGKQVVRLKGGDPYVFGRGGEEGEVLRAEGVPFEVVPGVTSAIGGLAYAGIPITHRDFTSSFHVFTGHFKEDSRDHNWEAIAGINGTLVFLMGVANIDIITRRLLENGLEASTPAALVSNATRSNQSVVTGTLSTITELAKIHKVVPPTLLVIGKVVQCREQLNWFEERPLFGQKIIVTRARHQASQLSKKLQALGADVFECPAIQIESCNEAELKQQVTQLSEQNWIIFMSENGVERFMNALHNEGLDTRSLSHLKFAVVGRGTADVLKRYGILADVIPHRFVAEGLMEVLEGKLKASDKVLLIHAANARELLPKWLATQCELTELEVYQSVPADQWSEALFEHIQTANWITFTSASTVTHFYEELERQQLALSEKVQLASIGPITSDTLTALGKKPTTVASKHSIDGLIEAIVAQVEQQ